MSTLSFTIVYGYSPHRLFWARPFHDIYHHQHLLSMIPGVLIPSTLYKLASPAHQTDVTHTYTYKLEQIDSHPSLILQLNPPTYSQPFPHSHLRSQSNPPFTLLIHFVRRGYVLHIYIPGVMERTFCFHLFLLGLIVMWRIYPRCFLFLSCICNEVF